MYRIEQTDAELLGTQAEIVYELTFDAAERHLLGIELEVTTRGEPCLGVRAAGMDAGQLQDPRVFGTLHPAAGRR
jgi:hypothetical protein